MIQHPKYQFDSVQLYIYIYPAHGGDRTCNIRISRFSRFPRKLYWVTGTLFTHVKPSLKFWGLLRKRVWYVRGLPWKLVGTFGSRNYCRSDLLRPWKYVCIHELIHGVMEYVVTNLQIAIQHQLGSGKVQNTCVFTNLFKTYCNMLSRTCILWFNTPNISSVASIHIYIYMYIHAYSRT